MANQRKKHNAARAWRISSAFFAVLCGLTILVWKQQVDHQRSLLALHTDDVATQTSRRLQVFVESHLKIASIFARRWSNHESADFTRQRFEEFASVLINELPGYHDIALVPQDLAAPWRVSKEAEKDDLVLDGMRSQLMKKVRETGEILLLAPFKAESGETALIAVLPLLREDSFLGYLLINFYTEILIDGCFHNKVQSEFHFVVKDEGEVLFRSAAQLDEDQLDQAVTNSETEFTIGNRTWHLKMAPRKARTADFGWTANLSVPLLGFILSLGMSVLVLLLSRRMELFRSARDKALSEIGERQKTEAALKVSYQRHALLSRKAITAQEEERHRLSVDLHDELGQILTAIRLDIDLLEKQLPRESGDGNNLLGSLVSLTEKATNELRGICKGLRPPLLDDLGLEPAVQLLVEEFKERAGISTKFELPRNETGPEISDDIALCVYRILQESLTNIRRHSKAKNVNISLVFTSTGLELSVSDDGVGFDMAELGEMRGWGLEGMQERASLVNGTVEVRSVQDRGTSIVFQVPITSLSEMEIP